MPIKSVFAGFHKLSGERVMKVFNPNGLFSAFVVENGNTPYSGKQVTAGEIQQEPLDFVPDTPEILRGVELMQEANEDLLDD